MGFRSLAWKLAIAARPNIIVIRIIQAALTNLINLTFRNKLMTKVQVTPKLVFDSFNLINSTNLKRSREMSIKSFALFGIKFKERVQARKAFCDESRERKVFV